MSENLIEVKNLCKYFPAGKKRTLKAVDNVSLTIAKVRHWDLWASPAVVKPPAAVRF